MRFLRSFSLVTTLVVLGSVLPAQAADVDLEDYRALKARVGAFDESLLAFRNSIQRLQTEMVRLRNDNEALRRQASAANTAVTQEQLSRLIQQVQEVERNRTKDKQQILDALDRLKNLSPAPAAPPAGAKSGATPAKPAPKAATPPAKKPAVKPAAKPAAKPSPTK